MFDHSFPTCAFFFLRLLLFLEVEFSSRKLIPLLVSGSVHSGPATLVLNADEN